MLSVKVLSISKLMCSNKLNGAEPINIHVRVTLVFAFEVTRCFLPLPRDGSVTRYGLEWLELVRLRGEWILLVPADVDGAETFRGGVMGGETDGPATSMGGALGGDGAGCSGGT